MRIKVLSGLSFDRVNFVFVAIGTAVVIRATAIELMQPLLMLARAVELVPRI